MGPLLAMLFPQTSVFASETDPGGKAMRMIMLEPNALPVWSVESDGCFSSVVGHGPEAAVVVIDRPRAVQLARRWQCAHLKDLPPVEEKAVTFRRQ